MSGKELNHCHSPHGIMQTFLEQSRHGRINGRHSRYRDAGGISDQSHKFAAKAEMTQMPRLCSSARKRRVYRLWLRVGATRAGGEGATRADARKSGPCVENEKNLIGCDGSNCRHAWFCF
jgi:hypothetical protein